MTTVHHNPSRSRTPASPVPRPDEAHWPGLATAPRSPLRAAVAERLFRHAVSTLPVRVVLPDGTVLGAGGPGGRRGCAWSTPRTSSTAWVPTPRSASARPT